MSILITGLLLTLIVSTYVAAFALALSASTKLFLDGLLVKSSLLYFLSAVPFIGVFATCVTAFWHVVGVF